MDSLYGTGGGGRVALYWRLAATLPITSIRYFFDLEHSLPADPCAIN